MQGGNGKIPKSLRKRITESNIIGDLASGMKTRKRIAGENLEVFLEETRCLDPALADFCHQNRVCLGLQDLHELSPGDIKSHAHSLAEYYNLVLQDNKQLSALQEEIFKAQEKLRKASKKEKEALLADLARIARSSEAMEKVNTKIQQMTGIDISSGLSGLMKSLGSKIGGKGGNEDPTETATDLECLKKITSTKSISTPVTMAKAVILAITVPKNIPFIGAALTMLPIMTMVWPALVAWDICNLPGNIMGSPFASGNINNLVKECEPGFHSGPRIAENMPGCSSKEKKARTPC